MNSSDPNTSRKSSASQKSSGICSVCYLTWKLHHKGGNLHLHGHRAAPCLGSNLPPLAESHPSLVTETSIGTINASIGKLVEQPIAYVYVNQRPPQTTLNTPFYSFNSCNTFQKVLELVQVYF